MIRTFARLPVARLTRGARGWVAVGAWTVLALSIAVVARSRGAAHGADRVLLGTYGALVLPLLAYVIVGTVLGARSLSGSTAPLVSFGARPQTASAVTIAVALVACVATSSVLATCLALLAHGSADPPLAADAIASAYAGALGGAAYASWFSLGSAFGRRGGGRSVFLVMDWLLGTGSGAAALVSPRAHLRNLLGGAPPVDLSGRASAGALVLLTLFCALLAIRRSRN